MIITITGPRSVGKSTISKLLAKKLKLNYTSSDEIGEKTFEKEGGLDKAIKSGIIGKFIKDSGYSLIREEYLKDNFVFDLAGGAVSSKKFPEANAKVRKIAKEKSIIIGLLPSKSVKESIEFLFEREKERSHFKEMDKKDLLEKTKESYRKFPPIFKKLCNKIVYVKDKSAEDVAEEIIKKFEKAL